ncbi:hypothetical protein DE146DRAFT_635060 [Phaeosphaeria sp. MPI-PUGE-AT-0046c]|nr:hypothetical protein DE146DRAFT_635060 [Phaeosphaeria sp. MPI-PUGE-AT-0046c]
MCGEGSATGANPRITATAGGTAEDKSSGVRMVLGRRRISGPPLERIATKCVEKPTVTKWRLGRFNSTEYPATDIGSHPLAPWPLADFRARGLVGSSLRVGSRYGVSSQYRKTLAISRANLVKSAHATPGRQVRVRVSVLLEYQVIGVLSMFPRTPRSSSTELEKDDVGSVALVRLDYSDLRRDAPSCGVPDGDSLTPEALCKPATMSTVSGSCEVEDGRALKLGSVMQAPKLTGVAMACDDISKSIPGIGFLVEGR